jgi:hypothetical protein
MENSNKISKGLQNLGNTCFFNSVLQLMIQCTVLNKLIIDNEINGTLIDIYKRYLISYTDTNSNSVIDPREIVSYVSNLLGRNRFQQEDADQYITFIIDCIIDEFKELSKISSYKLSVANKNMTLDKLIDNLFKIKCEKEICCSKCDYISKTNDDINKLYLSLNTSNITSLANSNINGLNLDNLINNYLNETLDAENMWKCEKCNNMIEASIERNILKLPKYLIITLKRYANNNRKINDEINMPLDFTTNTN